MQPILESFSIVINGAWNPSIFTSEWLEQNIDPEDADQQRDFTVAFPIDDPTAPRRITFENIELFPGRKTLMIRPSVPSKLGIARCAKVISNICGLLSHTPVGNCGVNFGFNEENNLKKIYESLSPADSVNIGAEYRLEVTLLTRQFTYDDGSILNLSLSDDSNAGQVKFNFHSESNSIQAYMGLFDGTYVEDRYDAAIEFCKNVYDLELEEINEQE